METTQAKMFVRSLNNSTAKILMAFLLAGCSLDVRELRGWTGLQRQTIYDALEDLKALGMVENQVLGHGRNVWLPSSDLLPGFQMSKKRTSELPDVQKTNSTTLIGGGESINLTDSESINPPDSQMSEKRTSELPGVIEILQHTDLLFDGALVVSRDLEDREPHWALAWCAYAYREKSKLNGAGGLVRNRLKDDVPPPEWAQQQWRETLPSDFLEALGLAEYTCEICEANFKKMTDLTTHQATHPKWYLCPVCGQSFYNQEDLDAHYDQEHTPTLIKPDESISKPIHEGSSLTPEQAWQSVIGQLQMEMPRASFDSWVRDTKAIRYGRNTLTVGVCNSYARDWLESRLASTVNRLLVGITNEVVVVDFVTAEPSEVP
jgi:hypothetical protein